MQTHDGRDDRLMLQGRQGAIAVQIALIVLSTGSTFLSFWLSVIPSICWNRNVPHLYWEGPQQFVLCDEFVL